MLAAALGGLRAVCTFLERATYITPRTDGVFESLRQELWAQEEGQQQRQRRRRRGRTTDVDSDSTDVSTDVSVGYQSSDQSDSDEDWDFVNE